MHDTLGCFLMCVIVYIDKVAMPGCEAIVIYNSLLIVCQYKIM